MSQKLYIETVGCPMNLLDSELVAMRPVCAVAETIETNEGASYG